MKHHLLAYVILVLAFCSCSSDNGGGYSGPANLQTQVHDGINIAIANLQPMTQKDLVWKWDKWNIRVNTHPVSSVWQGREQFELGGHEYCGYHRQGTLHFPPNPYPSAVIHEAGHMVLYKNGLDPDPTHQIYREFWNRFTCGAKY